MINPKDIFNIQSSEAFERIALDIFRYQFNHNSIYRSYCDLLFRHPADVKSIEDIPYLPIEIFKTKKVLTGTTDIAHTFRSSGTTDTKRSEHHLIDLGIYCTSFRIGFKLFYGDIQNYAVLALLPSYLEREDASLVYMTKDWIEQSGHKASGFYLDNLESLSKVIKDLESAKQPTILIGVTFALLNLAEQFPQPLKHTIIMETGGMKGQRKELIRHEVHHMLKSAFKLEAIHSEYGMTELLSQAYSKGDGLFQCPPWMKVLIREQEDPFQIARTDTSGGVNIIDLANIHSCSFIATQDLGKRYQNNSFEILGRFDDSDIRGCNLMVL